MATDSKQIIASIEKDNPRQQQPIIENLTDLNIEDHVTYINQYIIGATGSDPLERNIRHYEYRMKEKLENVATEVKCLGWGFEEFEIDELKSTLSLLSEYFQVKMDIDKMVERLNIKNGKENFYFIVITIVKIPILFAE